MNNDKDWRDTFINKFKQQELTFNELYTILLDIKREGFDKEFAYNLLKELNINQYEIIKKHKDLLPDLMDIATSFCSPKLRIW